MSNSVQKSFKILRFLQPKICRLVGISLPVDPWQLVDSSTGISQILSIVGAESSNFVPYAVNFWGVHFHLKRATFVRVDLPRRNPEKHENSHIPKYMGLWYATNFWYMYNGFPRQEKVFVSQLFLFFWGFFWWLVERVLTWKVNFPKLLRAYFFYKNAFLIAL